MMHLKFIIHSSKFMVFCLLSISLLLGACDCALAQDKPSSKSLVEEAWQALGTRDYGLLDEIVRQCVTHYKDEAREQQASLSDFPEKDKIEFYGSLNDVATCMFVEMEGLVRQEKQEEAKDLCRKIIKDYSFAQAWDPRGWYWSVPEKAQATLDKLEKGIEALEESYLELGAKEKKTEVILYDKGTEFIIDYEKYGEFKGIGTKDYKFIVKDQEGLSKAAGEGIYPNTTSVRWDPKFVEAKKEKRLFGKSHWDLVNSSDLEAAFYRWALFPEPKGVSLFYLGHILEKAGLYEHAIKAYYAIVVHFPQAVGWTYWKTPWYVGQAAIAKIKFLIKRHPELELKLVNAKIDVINGYDHNISNDEIVVNPGKLIVNGIPVTFFDRVKKFFKKLSKKKQKVTKVRGYGQVRLVQYENGDWQLLVDDKPYIIRGVTYAPTKVGQGPDDGTLSDWMEYDYNNNEINDPALEAFVDRNGNGKQDKDEPSVGDFQLMKEMGVNTLRVYHQPFPINKKLLRKLYKDYGIRVVMGDFLGKYAIGSGATWFDGTDYGNPEHQKNMLESVKKMVLEFKDEPYILMWLLGNENVYGVACNADKNPEAFFKFCNEAAFLIKTLDQDHPVGIASGDVLFLDDFAKHCNEIDVFGTNAYRGEYGFGAYWQQVEELVDIPAMITEYGCPAYSSGMTKEEALDAQADYHLGCWEDIQANMAGGSGHGNSIGAFIFQYLDEWWKAYEPSYHDRKGLFAGPFPDGYMHEEWLGVCGQGDGKSSPYLRTLRPSYFTYKKLWNKGGGLLERFKELFREQ